MGDERSTEEKYTNVNPYTDQFAGQVGGAYQGNLDRMNDPSLRRDVTHKDVSDYLSVSGPNPFDMSGIGQANDMASGVLGNVYNHVRGYQPGQGIDQFFRYVQPLTNVAMGNFSPLGNMLNMQAHRQSQEGMNSVANQFGSSANINSGAARAGLASAGMNPFAQVQAQLGGQQAGLSGDLLKQAMGITSQEGQFGVSTGLQAGQLGMQGADLGMRGAGLSLQGQTDQARMGMDAQLANQRTQQQHNQFNSQMQMQAMMANQQAGLQQMGMYGGLAGQGLGAMSQWGNPMMEYQPNAWEQYGSPMMSGLFGLGGQLGGAALSDGRLKNEEGTVTGLKKVLSLRPARFRWKGKQEPDTSVGLIAQEVEQVEPGLVKMGQDGLLMIDYGGVTALAVQAVKELFEVLPKRIRRKVWRAL